MNASDCGPKSTRDWRLTLVATPGGAMDTFIRDIVTASRHRVVPVHVGKNDLEFQSFVEMVARRNGLGDNSSIRIVHDESPRFVSEYENDERLRMIVFRNGDRISQSLQSAFTLNLLPRIRVVMPVVSTPSKELLNSGKWEESFFKVCSKTFIWPTWSDRAEDHTDILGQMHAHLPKHDLATDEAKAYLRNFMGGTKDVYHLLRRAIAAARRENPDAERAQVTEYHLNVADAVRERVSTSAPSRPSDAPSEHTLH